MSCAARPTLLSGTDGAEAMTSACPARSSQMRALVPRRQRPAVERDALDHVVAALLEDRDAGVDVRHAVERRQLLRPEVLTEDRGAEEEVHEAPVRDAEHALVLDACAEPVGHAPEAADDGGERLGAGLRVV